MTGMFDRLRAEIDRREKVAGLSPADLLDLPEDLLAVIQLLIRKGEMTAANIAAEIGEAEEDTSTLLAMLEEKGMVYPTTVDGEARWQTAFAARRQREVPLDIWAALNDKLEDEE